MKVIDKLLGAVGIGGGGAMSAPPQAAPRLSGAYMRGGRNVTFATWRPPLREPQSELAAAWDGAAARVIDAVHNSGWLAGAIDQAVANTVGTGMRLKVAPDAALIGMAEGEARRWAQLVEQRFTAWARNPVECDVTGLRTFAQMQEAAFRGWIAYGEIFAELPYLKRPWNTYGTKIRLISPHRLKRTTNWGERLYNGVYCDEFGMPIAYLATRRDQWMVEVQYIVNARDAMGRPNVMHIFTGVPETYRGISPLTPALQVARQFDQLSEATLTSAVLQTLFAATITGEFPTDEMLQGLLSPQEQARMMSQGLTPIDSYFDMIGGFYENATIDTGINGRIAHLFPGQKLDFHKPQGAGIDYLNYTKTLLREIARCLGMTYESATGDYQGATYASLNNASAEIHAVTKARREAIIVPFCQTAYEAWLEEAVLSGVVPFPGGYEAFMANRAAATRAEWRGPPRPQGDDLKLAKAHEVWARLGVITADDIANDLGRDIEDVYAQLAREHEMREELELPEPSFMNAGGGKPEPAGGGGEEPEEPDETED